MRIAIGQLWQETNTFNPIPTTAADFERFGIHRGDELIERMAKTNELGGFIQSLRSWPERPEIVGLVRLAAWPGGQLSAATLDWLRQELLGAIERALPVDAVLLALHGALVADAVPDVEGAILEAVRQRVGDDIPIVATLDLHANVSAKMAATADALVLYHTYPHIDVLETGQRGAAVLRRILVDGVRPVTALQKLPLVVPAERANTQQPGNVACGFRKQLEALEATPGILAAGLATVQPWLDIPELGGAVVVVAEDVAVARAECARVAAEVWAKRREYLPELVPLAEAVRRAYEAPEGLVVLGDGADSTTSGAPGDSTHLLAELLKYEWSKPVLTALVSPHVVAECQRLGVGGELKTTLGGVRDQRHCRPLPVTMSIVRLFEAKFVLSGHLARNLTVTLGPSAVLRCGSVHVLVTSWIGPHFAPEFFLSAGFDPFAARVVVAKSPGGYRADYQAGAVEIIQVQTAGCSPTDFSRRLEYRNIPRPLWPWDEMPAWTTHPTIHGLSGRDLLAK
jgi:microcystin degradation protein MlrC